MSKLVDVPYLEKQDFNADGSLKSLKGKPVIVMVHGEFCGYCTQAKPAFQELANALGKNGNVSVATLQIDASPGEKECANYIKQNDPSYQGVPHYVLFDKDGRFLKAHTGGRDAKSLMNFCK